MTAAFRNWLMNIIAGPKAAYWVSDHAVKQSKILGAMPGAPGAILLVKAMEDAEIDEATFTFSGWEVSIKRAGPSDKEGGAA